MVESEKKLMHRQTQCFGLSKLLRCAWAKVDTQASNNTLVKFVFVEFVSQVHLIDFDCCFW